MNENDSPDKTRRSALALLADGNSVDSVAHVFGVSVDTLIRWQKGGLVDAGTASPPASPHPAPVQHRVQLSFESEVAQALPLALRLVMVGLGAMLVMMALVLRRSMSLGTDTGAFSGFAQLMALMPAGIGVWMILKVRTRLVLGRHDIVSRRVLGADRMAYADVASVEVIQDVETGSKGQKFPGRRVTIRSTTPGIAPLSVFMYDRYRVDPAFAQRLERLPGLSPTSSAVLAMAVPLPKRPMPKVVAGGLMLLVVIATVKYMRFPVDTIATLRHGQPALSQLERVDGDLLRLSACTQSSSKSPWYRDASIRTDTGVVMRTIGCHTLGHPFADGERHRVTIYDDAHDLARDDVYQVELDGQTLLRYDTVAAQRSSSAQFLLMAELFMLLAPAAFLYLLGRMLVDDNWADD